jgi:transcriptional regulator
MQLLPGTLDMLLLSTLRAGPEHGWGLARTIERRSGGALVVEEGSLYPALARLRRSGWVRAEPGRSANNRPARFYRLTAAGRRESVRQERLWREFAAGVAGVMMSNP